MNTVLSTTKKRTKTNILLLPDDIILNIFEHLTTAATIFQSKRISEQSYQQGLSLACTCRRLYALYPRVLKDLELWISGDLSDSALMYMSKYAGQYIQRLILRKCVRLSSSLSTFSIHCSKLSTLDLSHMSSVTDQLLEEICPNVGKTLKALLLRRCTAITDCGLETISTYCTNLHALDCAGLLEITDYGVQQIAKNMKDRLSILILSWCKKISDSALSALAHCNLQVLCLRGLFITNDGIETVVQGNGNCLKAIDIMDCPNITNECFTQILPRNCEYFNSKLKLAHTRSIFQNSVSLLEGYVHVVGGINQHGLASTLVCILDAGNANAFAFQVLSRQPLTLYSDEYKLLVSNSGLSVSNEARRFLMDSFGIHLPQEGPPC